MLEATDFGRQWEKQRHLEFNQTKNQKPSQKLPRRFFNEQGNPYLR